MKFEITSNVGVGPVSFGMPPAAVRNALGVPFESFKRTPQSAYPLDSFPSLNLFVYYTAEGKVEAVEFGAPAIPLLNGENLLEMGFSDVVSFVSKRDANVVVEDDGFTSKLLGVGGYAPFAADSPSEPPESIIVFSKGYYD